MTSSGDIRHHEEELLVIRAQNGDRAAFAALMDRHERRLVYYLLRLVNDAHTALDVAQDVWLTVFRQLHSLNAPEAFRVWLYRIAHDKAMTWIRRERREADLYASYACEVVTETEGFDLHFDDAEAVHWALGRLPLDQREALTLRFLEGLSLEQMSEVLCCPIGTAKSRLHYAQHAIREELEKHVHE